MSRGSRAVAAVQFKAGSAAEKRNRSSVDGSRARSAAISGLIACGLLVGGAGGIGVAVAFAGPGSDGGQGRGQDSGSKGGGSGRGDGHHGGHDHGGHDHGDGCGGGGGGGGSVRGGSGSVKPRFTSPIGGGRAGGGGGIPSPTGTRPGLTSPSNQTGGPGPSVEHEAAEHEAVASDGGGVVPSTGIGLAPIPIGLPMVMLAPPAVDVAIRPVPPPQSAPQVGPRAPGREPPTGRETAPTAPVGRAAVPDSFRAGYPEYLRSARMVEVVGLAVPGVAGILALTAVGGLVGYRQAKTGLAVRAAGTVRFLHPR
jgi:hypothetical protein